MPYKLGYIIIITIFSGCISYFTIKRFIMSYMPTYINNAPYIRIIILLCDILFINTMIYGFLQV